MTTSSSSFSDLQEDSLPLFQEEDVLTCFEERSYIKDLDTSYNHRLLRFLDPSPVNNSETQQNKRNVQQQQNSYGKQLFSQQEQSKQMIFPRANQGDKFERPPLSQRVEGTTAGSIISSNSSRQQQALHQTQPMNKLHSISLQERSNEGIQQQFQFSNLDKENNHPNMCIPTSNAKRSDGLAVRDIPDFQKKTGSYDTQLRENLKKSIALLKESSKHHNISYEDSDIHPAEGEKQSRNDNNISHNEFSKIEKIILDGIRQVSVNLSQVKESIDQSRKHRKELEDLKDGRDIDTQNSTTQCSGETLLAAKQALEKQFMEFIANFNTFLNEAQLVQQEHSQQLQQVKSSKELEEHYDFQQQNSCSNYNNNQSNNILSTYNTNASNSSSSCINNSTTIMSHQKHNTNTNNKQNMRLIKNIANYSINNNKQSSQQSKQYDISQQQQLEWLNQSELTKQSFSLQSKTLLDNSSQRNDNSIKSNYISTQQQQQQSQQQQQQAPLSARESSNNRAILSNKSNYNSSQALKTTTPLSARDTSTKLQQQYQLQQASQLQSQNQRSSSSTASTSESSRSQQQQQQPYQQQQLKERSVSSDLGVILNHSLMGNSTIYSANKTGRSSNSNEKSTEKTQGVLINGQIISRISSQQPNIAHSKSTALSYIAKPKDKCDSFSIVPQHNQQFKSAQLYSQYHHSSSYSQQHAIKADNHKQSSDLSSSSHSMLLPCQNNNTSCDQSQASMGSELKRRHSKHPSNTVTSSSNRSLSQSQSSQNIVDNLLSQLSGQRAPEKLCRFMQAHPPSSSSLSDGQNCLKTKSSRESIRPVNLDSYLLDEPKLQVHASQIAVKTTSGYDSNSICNEKNSSRNSSKAGQQYSQQDDSQKQQHEKNPRESSNGNGNSSIRTKSSSNSHNSKPCTFQEKYTLIKQQLALKII